MLGIYIVSPGVEMITPKHLPNWAEVAQSIIEDCGRTCYQSEPKEGDTPEAFIKRHINHESMIEHFGFTVRFTCSRTASHQLVRHRLAAYSQESQRFCDYKKERLQDYPDPFCDWMEKEEMTLGGVRLLKVVMPPKMLMSTELNGHAVFPDGDHPNSSLLVDGESMDAFLSMIPAHPKRPFSLLLQIANRWCRQKIGAYRDYLWYREHKIPSEDARFDLPNACKTEVATTYNFRMWRHVLGHPVFGRTLNSHAQWEIKGITLPVLELFEKEIPSMFGDLRGG